MITLKKTGKEVKIVEGSKKSVYGQKPFKVRLTSNSVPITVLIKHIWSGGLGNHWNKNFKVQRSELSYDSEQELLDAIKVKGE